MRCSPEERKNKSTSLIVGESKYFAKVFSVIELALTLPRLTSRARAVAASTISDRPP
ncbi:unannotated protein [freshwater metagenome]|uniref:Unannotated protein n=1 Tax=freshwater metagenome TaxID=449393 RepID=A0A6J6M1X7_9ZZZZ